MSKVEFQNMVEGIEYKDSNIASSRFANKYIRAGKYLKVLTSGVASWDYSELGHNEVAKMRFVEVNYKPEIGENYWYPAIDALEAVAERTYSNSFVDERIIRKVGVYRDKEDAVVEAEILFGPTRKQ